MSTYGFTGLSVVRPSKPGFGYGKQQQLRNLGVMIWLHAGYGGSMTVPKAKVCFQYTPMIFSHLVGRKCRYNREVSCVWKNTRMSNYRANGAKSLPTSSQKFRTISEFSAPKYLLRTSWSWYNLSLEAVPMSSG